MASPSPSDLLWVLGFTPQGRWIVPIVREVVRAEWPTARQIARAQLGDETLAHELMESAIEQTHEHLASQPPVGVEEARRILNLCYRNAVRRKRRSASRLLLYGNSSDLDPLAPSVPTAANGVEARLDVNAILRDTSPDVRHALLARYGAKAQWVELAKNLDTPSGWQAGESWSVFAANWAFRRAGRRSRIERILIRISPTWTVCVRRELMDCTAGCGSRVKCRCNDEGRMTLTVMLAVQVITRFFGPLA